MTEMKPSERYRVLLNVNTGRTHLLDVTVPEPTTAGDRSGIVCCDEGLARDVLWPMDAYLTELDMVDDYMIGPPTWGGACRACYGWVADQRLAAVSA